MAKKQSAAKGDRSDPKQNKSLAIRLAIKKSPTAKATEIAETVKKEYGHSVSPNMIYMVKTKTNMASDGRPRKAKGTSYSPMTSPTAWIEAISAARQLLQITGSVANATALLKAIDG